MVERIKRSALRAFSATMLRMRRKVSFVWHVSMPATVTNFIKFQALLRGSSRAVVQYAEAHYLPFIIISLQFSKRWTGTRRTRQWEREELGKESQRCILPFSSESLLRFSWIECVCIRALAGKTKTTLRNFYALLISRSRRFPMVSDYNALLLAVDNRISGG